MRKINSSVRTKGKPFPDSFTLIELLVVIAIIAILVGLSVAAGSAVIKNAMRNRSTAEIQAYATKLEDYKSDNGAYPPTSTIALLTNTPYEASDGSQAGAVYQQASQQVYMALSGKTNYLDSGGSVKTYMSFKTSQVGNAATAANTAYSAGSSSYVKDPWGYSYGYSTGTGEGGGTTNYPFNGQYNFDMWSTAGGLVGPPNTQNTNSWISNYQ